MSTTSIPEVFRADKLFSDYLISRGFKDVTSAHNKPKGKKEYRHPDNRNRVVYFDYINIKLRHGAQYDLDADASISRKAIDFWIENKMTDKNLKHLKELAGK